MGGFGQLGHLVESRAAAGVDDHHAVGLAKRPRCRLHLPPIRCVAAPRRERQHADTVPYGQLGVQRIAVDTAQRRLNGPEPQPRFVFDAQQHVQATALKIRIHQCAVQVPLPQRAGQYGGDDAQTDPAAGRGAHHRIPQPGFHRDPAGRPRRVRPAICGLRLRRQPVLVLALVRYCRHTVLDGRRIIPLHRGGRHRRARLCGRRCGLVLRAGRMRAVHMRSGIHAPIEPRPRPAAPP